MTTIHFLGPHLYDHRSLSAMEQADHPGSPDQSRSLGRRCPSPGPGGRIVGREERTATSIALLS